MTLESSWIKLNCNRHKNDHSIISWKSYLIQVELHSPAHEGLTHVSYLNSPGISLGSAASQNDASVGNPSESIQFR